MRRTAWGGWLAVALGAALTALGPSRPARAQDGGSSPPAHASLRYHLVQGVSDGFGAYDGWEDTLVSVGVYASDLGSVHARYDWRYGSPDRGDSGAEVRDVSFDPSTRLYAGRTDLDDYDDRTTPLTTWLWIPTGVPNGARVQVLEETLAVVGRESLVIAGQERDTIHLHGEANGTRDDAYGEMTTRAIDDYWYDAATGMFLRERRVEHDSGRFEGERAGFTMTLRVDVVDASYAPAVGSIPSPPELPEYGSGGGGEEEQAGSPDGVFSFFGIALVASFVFFLVGVRSARNPYGRSPYDISPLGANDPLPPISERFSPVLAPFLPHMIEVARRSSCAVFVARSRGDVAGVAIDDPDAKVVAVYTELSDVAEALRRAAQRDELVSEYRYRVLSSVEQVAKSTGTTVPEQAYNLYETYDLLTLALAPDDEPQGYDTHLVRRMRPEDVEEAALLAERVYGARCDAFFRASLALGDVAFVAEEDGEIFGVALATVVGARARLHSLMVDPDARQRGIGKELYRARVRACADLAVDTIVTEVSRDNPAAMDLALRFGMKKVDEMYVQSARQARVEIAPVHR